MKKELLFYDDVTEKQYLTLLLNNYPYGIEEEMVYSLLNEHPYPHPVLLTFISYFESTIKFHILTKEQSSSPSLSSLFLKMSTLAQKDSGILHAHHFDYLGDILLTKHTFAHPYAHLPFHKILFIDEIHLHHTPLLPMSDYQPIPIKHQSSFIYRDISIEASNFVAISIQITQKHGLIFLSKDCLSLAIPLRAMFHAVKPSIHQDFILIFGLSDALRHMDYYYDETNEVYIGLVSGDERMHHFLYLKEMILTLYNALRIHQHDLPIHASMLQFTLHDKYYGLLFAGERTTGKSEMLTAFIKHCKKEHLPYQAFYDDHGTLHYLDNEVVTTAIELSACKKLSTQDVNEVFYSYEDSIFLREEDGTLYQIIPLICYDDSTQFHPVTHIIYLDNTQRGKEAIPVPSPDRCTQLFEKGAFLDENRRLCSSYFFNRCGCEENDLALQDLLHEFITIFYLQNILVYQLFTNGNAVSKQTLFRRLAKRIFEQIKE